MGFTALLVCLVVIFSSFNSYAQTCDFFDSEDIVLINTGNSVAAGITTTYVLTDLSGTILQSSPASTFTNPGTGDFVAYAVNYDSAEAAPALAVGDDINLAIATDCVDTASLPLTICSQAQNCNYLDGEDIVLTNTGNTVGAGIVTTYVLTDLSGTIVVRSGTSTLSSSGVGSFIAYAVNYDSGAVTPALTVGDDINAVIGLDCVDTASLPLTVCACALGSELDDTELVFNLSGDTQDILYAQEFILTDGTGTILQTQTTNPITGLSNNRMVYNVYSLVYDTRPAVNVGDNINDLDLSAVCGEISEPLGFTLCRTLPVELVYFKGNESDCEAHLSWGTASEVNVSHFEVQKSFDGLGFSTISRIDAAGGELIATDYTYTDIQIANTNYYRLKIVDTDGSFEYSDVVTIGADCVSGVSISDIFPNPVVSGVVNVRFNSNVHHEDAILVLTDVLGRKQMEVPVMILEGTNLVSIDPSRLPSATYFLHIQGTDWRTAHNKFVKLNK